ncbi:alpha/beta hydrolase [Scatolibacter rhodanostii]|uniref:alpha/beta hydrolase n=1 Tax=Scatolibacter rhodanostii TaxID=2014781 RepID=UPI000C07906A|nr:alpha/beta hydrolase-fold protein [Scatolibacter rhodanostii]
MAQIHCNFFSYSLCHGVDIAVTLPSFTSCNMDEEHTHQLPEKFPVVYLLHGHGNDYMVWHRYTNVDRYAEEKRIAIVTFSVGNKAYMNAGSGDNYYDFLEHELPNFVESYFPVSSKPEERYIAGLSMGGYGALLHGLENPERYSAIGAFSPAVFAGKDLLTLQKEKPDMPPFVDIIETTKNALASGKKLPDLFLCIGDKDFLYEKVTAYNQFLQENWQGARYRYDDLPNYEHEFSIWDLEVSAFLEWIDRKDVYKKMGPNKV